MIEKTTNIVEDTVKKMWKKRDAIYTALVIGGVVFTILLMYARVFLGTELSDEAYYVSEAKTILEGNVPYAYDNGSQAVGFTFLLIVVESFYRLFIPDLTGVFLFTRLCFVTYKMIIWLVVFSVFRRKNKLTTALLISALIIPLNSSVFNFSYNTIPEYTIFMVGCVLYDVIEQDAPRKELRLALSGIMTGIACFANPGWGIALIVFLVLIAVRVKGKTNKLKYLLCFGGTVLADVVIVVLSVSAAASFSDLCYGFYRMFISGIPSESIAPDKTLLHTISTFIRPVLQWILILIPVSLAAYFLSPKLLEKKGKKWSKDQLILFSITVPFFVHSMYIILTCARNLTSYGGGEIRGFTTFCYMLLFIAAGAYKKDRIIWYLGIFQPIYAVAEIALVSADATIFRFINVYTITVPILYILIINKSKAIRLISGTLAVAVIVSQVYANYKLIYRDYGFNVIRHNQVQSGVYKGLYTSKSRANDLPELEEYLNSVIDEDDTYSFRDNAPYAYLMAHKGRACETMTWDVLQYSAHGNAPAVLFDYYRVRDMIPDKIIYVDSGRDDRLSILDPEFRYNDWVNTYYDLIDDVSLNETFTRVMVYQYNGKFDGDYQWWIDSYWNLVK